MKKRDDCNRCINNPGYIWIEAPGKEPRLIKCPNCGGRGWVPRPAETELENQRSLKGDSTK